MSRHMNLIIGAAALTAIGFGAAAHAQAQPEQRRVEREVRIERDHAQHLKNILQLRPSQEAALAAYLAAMQPTARGVRMDASGADARPKTTPERLARMEQRLAEREAAQRGRIEATRRFYAQLDAGQKKAFDELPLMMGPMMGDMPMRAMQIMHRLPRGEFPGGFRHEMPMPPAPPAPPAPPRQ